MPSLSPFLFNSMQFSGKRSKIGNPGSATNILILTSDHSLYKKHMGKVFLTLQKFTIIDQFKWNWREFACFKISLAVLYSIVWIWGLTGNSFYHLIGWCFNCHWTWSCICNFFICLRRVVSVDVKLNFNACKSITFQGGRLH